MADVKMKKPDGTWVSLKGPQGIAGAPGTAGVDGQDGSDGANGRSVAVFDQAGEPGAALAGDIWFEP